MAEKHLAFSVSDGRLASMSVEQAENNQYPDSPETKEKPFKGMKIYFSGSIKGAQEPDPEFAWKLVQYMVQGGANVLSEHVAARNKEEMEEIRAKKMGMSVKQFLDMPREIYIRDVVRKTDTEWVDEASHLVALVNAPSHGVGMEIERAILKPERGLPLTPILCLVREDLLSNLSGMVKGVSWENDKALLFVETYKTLQDANFTLHKFLTGNFRV